MRIYAQRPGRVALQVLADVAVLAWVVIVVVLARAARGAVLKLDVVARRVTGAGDAISRSFDAAARSAGRIPVVGDDLAHALGSVTDTGDSLSASGRDLTGVIASAGLVVAVTVVVLGVLPVVVVWLAVRLRWVLAARSAAVADPDLLALRALTRRPSAALHRAVPDPAAAWRRGDTAVVAALAAVELAALGLRPFGPVPHPGEPPG
jgi:hypothetical protein